MDRRAPKPNTRRDVLLIAALLVLCALSYGAVRLLHGRGAQVVAEVDGAEYGRWSLSDERTVEIVTERGRNLLVISDGTARVTEADCPDGICMNMGVIRYDGQSIICLPHRLTVTVVGGENSR